jgi:hypothetical protein
MMDATKAFLTKIGVSLDRLKTEQFGAVKPPLLAPRESRRHGNPEGSKKNTDR